jgi:integrase
MATIGKKNGVFHVRFRYGPRSYKRSLKTHSDADARMALHDVERALIGLERRILYVPAGIDAIDFILAGGRLPTPSATVVTSPPSIAISPAGSLSRSLSSIHELVADYLAAQVHKADSTRATERIHLRNLETWLGDRAHLSCNTISFADLEAYLVARSNLCEAATVEKERATIGSLFRWATANKNLERSPAIGLPIFKSRADAPRFKTMAEINRLIERGGLDGEELLDVWECLYLTPDEIASMLKMVRERADADFTPLLHAIPAYTGMRRGEVVRLKWSDIDFEFNIISAWSRKQSRSSRETKRSIDLHAELKQILLEWQRQRPRGQYVVCEDRRVEPLSLSQAKFAFVKPLQDTPWCLDRKRRRYKIGFHTYRHSFASNLAARGVDQRIIDEWMGHQTEAMRKRYQHLFPQARRTAIESFSLAGPTNDEA